jgi:hypothetical protein
MNTAFPWTGMVTRRQSRFTRQAVIYAAEGIDRYNGTNRSRGRFGRDQKTLAVGFGSVTNVTAESMRKTQGTGLKSNS